MRSVFVFIAASVFLLTACSGDDPASSSMAPSEVSSVPESTSGSATNTSAGDGGSTSDGSGTGSGTTSGEAAATAPSVDLGEIAGVFTCKDEERYPDDRAPSFTLDKDGKFAFHFNLGDGRLGTLSGSYTLSGSLTFNIEDRDCDDYLGQDMETLSFTMTDEDNFVYSGSPLGLTYNGNTFVREGAKKAKPKPESTPAESGSAASGADSSDNADSSESASSSK